MENWWLTRGTRWTFSPIFNGKSENWRLTRGTRRTFSLIFNEKFGDLPAVLDVLVDEARDAHGDEGKVPAGHEHDGQAQAEPEHGQGPGYKKICVYIQKQAFSCIAYT